MIKFKKMNNINKKKCNIGKINIIKMIIIKQKPLGKIYNKIKTLK